MSPKMNGRSQKGSLLIVILWIIAILALLGVSLGYRTALNIYSTRASSARLKASYISRAAAALAITVLKKDTSLDRDTTNDVWANNPQEFQDVEIGPHFFSIVTIENEEKRYGLTDEERKINLNTASKEVLENLFEVLEIEIDLVVNLLDWIDEDEDDFSHGKRGAEKDYYENLTPSYSPKNAPLEVLEELLLIKGFDVDLFERLKDHVTVYGSGLINANTATTNTWLALGFSDRFVEKIERFRLGEDGEKNTDDDGAASSFEEFILVLGQFESLEGVEKTLLNTHQENFTMISTAYQVKAHVKSSLLIEKDLTAILSLEEGKDVEIVYWHEN